MCVGSVTPAPSSFLTGCERVLPLFLCQRYLSVSCGSNRCRHRAFVESPVECSGGMFQAKRLSLESGDRRAVSPPVRYECAGTFFRYPKPPLKTQANVDLQFGSGWPDVQPRTGVEWCELDLVVNCRTGSSLTLTRWQLYNSRFGIASRMVFSSRRCFIQFHCVLRLCLAIDREMSVHVSW